MSNAILLHGVRLGDPTARVPVAPPVPQQWHGSARRQCVATGSPRRGATWPTARHLRRAPRGRHTHRRQSGRSTPMPTRAGDRSRGPPPILIRKLLPVRAVITTRTSAVSQSPCLATDTGRACLNFRCFCLVLGPPQAQTFSAWKHTPCLMGRTCLPDQGALRCMCSGTGAVPTVNVTLLSTRES